MTTQKIENNSVVSDKKHANGSALPSTRSCSMHFSGLKTKILQALLIYPICPNHVTFLDLNTVDTNAYDDVYVCLSVCLYQMRSTRQRQDARATKFCQISLGHKYETGVRGGAVG
jgi:hypothetical protein